MAAGDFVVFDQFLVDVGEEIHQLETDTFKLGLVTAVVTPSATTANPCWGAGGSTNLATNEVTAGGNYVAGGATCGTPTYDLTGGLAMFDTDDPAAWAAHASNPTNAVWGILYNDTTANKNCVGFVDLGGAFDMTTGPLTVTVNASGWFRLNQA